MEKKTGEFVLPARYADAIREQLSGRRRDVRQDENGYVVVPIYRRFWLWSKEPYARERMLPWVKVCVGFRYAPAANLAVLQ